MNQPVLSVRDLRVEFHTRRGVLTALDGISFDIDKGEVLGVVGESGAGKSITGNAIIGLIDPPGRIAGGEVRLNGARIDNLRPDAMRKVRGKKIGMIFQDPLTSLNPLYRVGEQLIETIRTHLPLSESQARKRAVDLLSEVGISAPERRIDGYPHEFSGGMRQRVVIALALCAEPDLVIADEPTTALDVSVQAQIIEVIKKLCRERGAAVMLITHDMGVIAEAADRVAVMYAGRIAEIGPVRDVIKSPLHPYATGLMGSIPSLEATSERLVQIPGSMPRLSAIPKGCAFHPRCPHAFARCHIEQPEPKPVNGRIVACHLHDMGMDANVKENAA
ncbi:MAG: ABC transporter ATP-binding protein [Beijerinckiaceae bacterium]